MLVLGLMGREGVACHDGSAALVQDGDVVAAVEQERLSRNKHAPGEAPNEAAKACLDAADITLDDIDYIAYGWNECADEEQTPIADFVHCSDRYTTEILAPDVWGYDQPPEIHFVDHHVSHLMAAVADSGFDDAACLIADGQGEDASTTLAEYGDGEIRILETYPISRSLGLFFDAASYYAGLGEFGGGKLMGLAPYGTPTRTDWMEFDEKTGRFDVRIEDHLDRTSVFKDGSSASENGPAAFRDRAPVFEDSSAVFNEWVALFESQCFPYREGSGESAVYYQDFAATVQRTLESVILSMLEYLRRNTLSDNLVVGGGVGLNSVLNRRMYESTDFEKIVLHPASNDAGVSVGAAYELCRVFGSAIDGSSQAGPLDPYTGPAFDDTEIIRAVDGRGFESRDLPTDRLVETVAADLANGRVVGWFQGETEFGPRALGHRSILADPSTRDSLYTVNELKGRARWRPLAPSVLAERFEDVLEGDCSKRLARYMLTTATVSPWWRDVVPAVVHADGTCRPQLVSESMTPTYYRLLEAFERRTGVPLLINTSFNLSGMPIVNRPEEALEVFKSCEQMDVLVLGNRYVTGLDAER